MSKRPDFTVSLAVGAIVVILVLLGIRIGGGAGNLGGSAIILPTEFQSTPQLLASWAPPYDVFNNNAPIITVTPEEPAPGASARVGFSFSTAAAQKLVYTQAYLQKAGTTAWTPITVQGDATQYAGFVTNAKDIVLAPTDLATGDNILATHVCTSTLIRTGASGVSQRVFACGCAATNLAACGRWNIQRITVVGPVIVPPKNCGNNVCDADEDSTNCAVDCPVGPSGPIDKTPTGTTGATTPTPIIAAPTEGATITLNSVAPRVTVTTPVAASCQMSSDSAPNFPWFTMGTTDSLTHTVSINPPTTPVAPFIIKVRCQTAGNTNNPWSAIATRSFSFTSLPTGPSATFDFGTTGGVTLTEGETRTISVGGTNYETTLLLVSDDGSVKFLVNGMATTTLKASQSIVTGTNVNGVVYTAPTIVVKSVVTKTTTGDGGYVFFSVGNTQGYLKEGQTITYTIGSATYETAALLITRIGAVPTVKFLVNGVASPALTTGQTFTSGTTTFTVNEILTSPGIGKAITVSPTAPAGSSTCAWQGGSGAVPPLFVSPTGTTCPAGYTYTIANNGATTGPTCMANGPSITPTVAPPATVTDGPIQLLGGTETRVRIIVPPGQDSVTVNLPTAIDASCYLYNGQMLGTRDTPGKTHSFTFTRAQATDTRTVDGKTYAMYYMQMHCQDMRFSCDSTGGEWQRVTEVLFDGAIPDTNPLTAIQDVTVASGASATVTATTTTDMRCAYTNGNGVGYQQWESTLRKTHTFTIPAATYTGAASASGKYSIGIGCTNQATGTAVTAQRDFGIVISSAGVTPATPVITVPATDSTTVASPATITVTTTYDANCQLAPTTSQGQQLTYTTFGTSGGRTFTTAMSQAAGSTNTPITVSVHCQAAGNVNNPWSSVATRTFTFASSGQTPAVTIDPVLVDGASTTVTAHTTTEMSCTWGTGNGFGTSYTASGMTHTFTLSIADFEPIAAGNQLSVGCRAGTSGSPTVQATGQVTFRTVPITISPTANAQLPKQQNKMTFFVAPSATCTANVHNAGTYTGAATITRVTALTRSFPFPIPNGAGDVYTYDVVCDGGSLTSTVTVGTTSGTPTITASPDTVKAGETITFTVDAKGNTGTPIIKGKKGTDEYVTITTTSLQWTPTTTDVGTWVFKVVYGQVESLITSSKTVNLVAPLSCVVGSTVTAACTCGSTTITSGVCCANGQAVASADKCTVPSVYAPGNSAFIEDAPWTANVPGVADSDARMCDTNGKQYYQTVVDLAHTISGDCTVKVDGATFTLTGSGTEKVGAVKLPGGSAAGAFTATFTCDGETKQFTTIKLQECPNRCGNNRIDVGEFCDGPAVPTANMCVDTPPCNSHCDGYAMGCTLRNDVQGEQLQ